MSPSVLLAILATIAAGAAALELARLPRRAPPPAHVPAATALQPPRWARQPQVGPLEALLDAAGREAVTDADALATRRRVGAVVAGCWVFAVLAMLAPPALALVGGGGGALAGWQLPLLQVRAAGRRRVLRLRDEAPELLDLLSVALGCGLPLRGALEITGQWTEGELSAALLRCGAELQRGAGTTRALEQLAREHPIEELESATAILERSRHHGTPAAGPLQALADSARQARARRAVEQAAKAAPKVQLVAALLLVPAALCVLAAALVAGTH